MTAMAQMCRLLSFFVSFFGFKCKSLCSCDLDVFGAVFWNGGSASLKNFL